MIMRPMIKKLFEQVDSWSTEGQEELVEAARVIEGRRTGVYVLSDDERAAIEEGLLQLDRGEGLSEDEMEPSWKRFGVV
jgi:hypothetical protein